MTVEAKPEQAREYQPDTQALFTMRRVMMMALACFGALTSFAVAVSQGSNLSLADEILACLALVLLAIGLIGSRRPGMLWFLWLAVFCMPIAALIAPTNSEPWVIMPNAVSNSSLLLVLLVPRWPGLAVPPIAGVLVLLIQERDASNVFSTTSGLLSGWFPPVQTMTAVLFLWWAWWKLRHESQAVDRQAVREELLAERAIEAYHRAQVWRRAAARLHESALNVIAHVLNAPVVDRAGLAHQLQASFPDSVTVSVSESRTSSGAPATLAQVLAEVAGLPGRHGKVTVRTPLPDLTLPADTADVLSAAINELIINAERHGQARAIRVAATVDEDFLLIQVTDDGLGLPSDPEPGIGLGLVLEERLLAAGGRFSLDTPDGHGTRASLRIPLTLTGSTFGDDETAAQPFDKARLLVSAPLAGLILVGIMTFLLLVQGPLPPAQISWTICIIGIALCVFSVVVVVRRKRYGLAETLALAPVPIAIAGLLLAMPPVCGDAALIGMVLNATGLCTVLIALWGHPVAGGITLATWAVAALSVVRIYPSACMLVVGQALNNSLIVVPLLALVAALGGRAFRRAQRRRSADRAEYVAMLARVTAARDLDGSVSGLVDQARLLLDSLPASAPLDASTRHALEIVDGRIRAAIQVDPVTSGGMALAAHEIVERAASRDRAVLVRSISSSGDARPLPSAVIDMLTDLVPGGTTPGVLRAMTDGEEDHIAVTTSPDQIRARDLSPGQSLVVDGIQIEIEHELADRSRAENPGAVTLTVVASRAVPLVDAAAATDSTATDSD